MLMQEGVSLANVGIVIGLTVLMSSAVTILLWRPLNTLLTGICGTGDRAHFWTVYSALFLFLLPLLVVTATPIGGDVARFVRLSVFFAACGVSLALVAVGYAIWSRMPKGGW